MLAVLPKRVGKFGLSLHPEKTRPIEFRPPRVRGPNGPSEPRRRRTFDLLGFTHYWTKSRRGYLVIKQKTATDRLSRAVRRVGQWCRDHRHLPVGEQHKELVLKVRGRCAYYGITGNAWTTRRLRSSTRLLPCARFWQWPITPRAVWNLDQHALQVALGPDADLQRNGSNTSIAVTPRTARRAANCNE